MSRLNWIAVCLGLLGSCTWAATQSAAQLYQQRAQESAQRQQAAQAAAADRDEQQNKEWNRVRIAIVESHLRAFAKAHHGLDGALELDRNYQGHIIDDVTLWNWSFKTGDGWVCKGGYENDPQNAVEYWAPNEEAWAAAGPPITVFCYDRAGKSHDQDLAVKYPKGMPYFGGF